MGGVWHVMERPKLHNTPFRFLDAPRTVALLRRRLLGIGFVDVGDSEGLAIADPYQPAQLRFAREGLSGFVEMNWHYTWWPDGMQSELSRVDVLHQGVVHGEVNVQELLRRRLTRPLDELIIDKLTALCAQLTDQPKPTDPRALQRE